MTTRHIGVGQPPRLPDVSRADRARFVREARRLRAQEIDRLLLAVGGVLARLWRASLPRAFGHRPSQRTS
jgi:hypothetical protein